MGFVAQPGTGRGRPGIKRNAPSPHRKLPDAYKVANLHRSGMSQREIARTFGVSESNVSRAIAGHSVASEGLELYKKHRADLLAGTGRLAQDVAERVLLSLQRDAENGVLSASPPEKRAGIARDLSVIYGVVFDKERLERGQSTHNTRLIASIMGSALDAAYDPVETAPKRLEVGEPSQTPNSGVRLDTQKARSRGRRPGPSGGNKAGRGDSEAL